MAFNLGLQLLANVIFAEQQTFKDSKSDSRSITIWLGHETILLL